MADPKAAPPSPDWTVQIADRIESLVGAVRDKTTVPVTKVARIAVFGILAGAAGAAALALLLVAVIRLHVYLPFHPAGRQVWVVDAVLGAIFLLAGAFLWRKRTPRRP